MEEDAKSCFENFGKDKNSGRFISLFPMNDANEMEQFVRTLVPNHNAWILIEKSSQQAIGYIIVDIPYPQLKIGEIGYVIGEKFQKNGYASVAVNVILHEYLLNRDLFMIEAKYNEHNTASANLLEKMGFHQDGRLRDRRIYMVSGDRNDLVICSMTKDEFLKSDYTYSFITSSLQI